MADQEIEAILHRAEREIEQARQRVRERNDARIETAIPGGIGTVVVNGYGVLRNIMLDPDAVRRTTPERLGRHVADTINKAESRARRRPSLRPDAVGGAGSTTSR